MRKEAIAPSEEEGESWRAPTVGAMSSSAKEESTLFLFLDESGNFDFSPTGTEYFVMTCLVSRKPFTVCHELMDVKYAFFEHGIAMRKFHATEDNNDVRAAVYNVIAKHCGALSAYAVYVDKSMLPEDLRDAGVLYAKVFEWIVEKVLSREVSAATKKVVVVTDEIPKDARKRQVAKPLKKRLKEFSEKANVCAYLAHYPSESDLNLQIADYLCWAFMRKEAKGYSWPFSKVEHLFAETARIKI